MINDTTQEFDALSWSIHIETSLPELRVEGSLNCFQHPEATVVGIEASPPVIYPDSDDHEHLLTYNYEVSEDYLEQTGFNGNAICLKSPSDGSYHVYGSSSHSFSCKELIDVIVDFEQKERPKTNWLGGMDVHHVWFEGLCRVSNSCAFFISWGSWSVWKQVNGH